MDVPLLWAIGFANLPLLQLGIGAAALPILIHLLNRRKHREMRWAAMRFLVAALEKNRRRVRVEQWLLLLVRTLVVLAAVLAMAKPFLESLGALPLLPGQRTHRVLVLDGSLSMGYTTPEGTRFERSKALAARLVQDARRGDALSVVVMADPPRIVVGNAAPSSNQAEILKEIASIVLPHGGTDLVASFRAIDRALEVSSIPRKEVVFLSDLQAASWRVPAGSAEALQSAVNKLAARRAQSTVIDLGKDGGENRAVVDLRLGAPVVTQTGPAPIVSATVRNFGPAASGVKARLLIDGQIGPEGAAQDIPAGGDATFAFAPSFTAPGDHLLEVQIDDDALPLDDRRRVAVPVRPAIAALLVDGSPKAEPFQGETDYLAQALNPEVRSADMPTVIQATVVAESQIAQRDLTAYDVVVLANVAQVTGAEVAALDAYLKQGGGVVVFSGDQVDPENYNRLLHQDGSGLLPAAIVGVAGDAASKKGAFDFDPLGFRHPIVSPYNGAAANVVAGLTGAKTWQFHRLRLPAGTRAKVALGFDGGDPAVVEMPRHRGTVIQVATSADAGWTTWPLHQSYPPIMEQVILQAAAGRTSERNVRVGQPLDQNLPATAGGAAVEVTRPDGTKAAAKVAPAGDVASFHFEDTDLSGAYLARLATPTPRDTLFAANPDPAESDPAKLDRSGLVAAVPGWTFAYLPNWRDLTENATEVGRRGELHRPLLYALLALLLIESTLAWRFGHHSRP